VNGVDWAFAPDWLTIEQACFLSGHDREAMLEIIEVDGVALNVEDLIEERSLWEFQEALARLVYKRRTNPGRCRGFSFAWLTPANQRLHEQPMLLDTTQCTPPIKTQLGHSAALALSGITLA
jgi:hypothetical protein